MSRQAEAARLRERVAELESMLGECYVLSVADTDGDPPERRWEDAVRAVGKLRRDYDDCLDKLPDEPKRDEAGLREAATFVEALGPIIDLLDLDGFDGEAECLRDLRTALTAHPAPSEPEGDALRDALLELHDTVWKDECSATYCACQAGGMVYLAAKKVDALKAEPEAPAAPPQIPTEMQLQAARNEGYQRAIEEHHLQAPAAPKEPPSYPLCRPRCVRCGREITRPQTYLQAALGCPVCLPAQRRP